MGQGDNVKDVYIAVMGVTGAGKSSFIAKSSGLEVKVGHDLISCTTDVEDVSFMYNDHLRVHLIDTPGFDDTNRSDVEVLQDISHWLAKSFERKIFLKGIIFLHRIIDPRMTGAALRNLSMFKKLCGPEAYKSVILATTMWSKVDPAEGDERERQLKDNKEFWGAMCKRGSTVRRYLGTKESALEIIDYILRLHKDKVVLEIQKELVTEGKDINDTLAAVALNAELVRERQRHEQAMLEMKRQMQEAIEERDKELQEDFQEEINALQAKIEKGMSEQRKLAQSLEEVNRRKEAEFQAFKVQIQQKEEEDRRRHQLALEEQRKVFHEQQQKLERLHEVEVKRLEKERAERVEEDRRRTEELQRRQEAQMKKLLDEQARRMEEDRRREEELRRKHELENQRLMDEQGRLAEQKRQHEFARLRAEAEEANRKEVERARIQMANEKREEEERRRRDAELIRQQQELKLREYKEKKERLRREDEQRRRDIEAARYRERQALQEKLDRREYTLRGALGGILRAVGNKFASTSKRLGVPSTFL